MSVGMVCYLYNFTFNYNSINDLWQIDANISYKDKKLSELIRGIFLWIV
jgi:hypothetical protein